LAVALAHLTYVGIERPLQRRVAARIGARAPQLRDLRPFAISLVAVACAALLIVRANGVPARYVAGVRDEVAVLRAADRALVDAAQQASVRCVPEAQTRQGSWCFRRDHAPPRIAILGDSHAEALYATLVTALPRDAGPLLVGRPGCAPTLLPTVAEADSPEARNRARCHRAVRLALDLIEREPTVHTVLLASRGAFQVTGTAFGHETGLPILPVRSDAARPDTARLVALWVEGMARTIARLQATGRRVILVVDHPELGFDPRSCVTGRPLGLRSVRTPCAIPRAALDARTAGYRAAIDELARRIPGLERYDTVEPLCDARWCRAYVDGALLYHDDDHLSRAGADRVFTPLARRLHGEMAQVASRH
ncbi:MAG: hypothetical protein MUF21_07425, partial [Gemmatimonadaceae bacterium]|nr:hypothetical protein [Gemmatimonadaceae bacterium]